MPKGQSTQPKLTESERWSMLKAWKDSHDLGPVRSQRNRASNPKMADGVLELVAEILAAKEIDPDEIRTFLLANKACNKVIPVPDGAARGLRTPVLRYLEKVAPLPVTADGKAREYRINNNGHDNEVAVTIRTIQNVDTKTVTVSHK